MQCLVCLLFAKTFSNVPSHLLKSVCAKYFLCATFYQHSSMFRTPCRKCVLKHFYMKIYVRSKFSCVRSSHYLCARAHASQLRGNIDLQHTSPSSLLVRETFPASSFPLEHAWHLHADEHLAARTCWTLPFAVHTPWTILRIFFEKHNETSFTADKNLYTNGPH